MRTINYLANKMEAMRYYNNETDCPKRREMIEDKDNLYIATEKHDGCWALCAHYSKGNNLIRSRSISKVTGAYGDYTAKLPHICEEMDKLPDNTVLLAEICWDEPGTNANTVGTILRCLPAKAVERQKDKKLKALVFDLLMLGGYDDTNEPYEKRFEFASQLMMDCIFPSNIMYMTQLCHMDEHHENFLEWADEIISEGGEGLVIQRKDNPYMPGTRTAWKTLKLKQSLPEMELKVVGVLEPNKLYEGDFIEEWKYWEGVRQGQSPETEEWFEYHFISTEGNPINGWDCLEAEPVTKPYAMGWKNGITVEFNGTTCDVASGLTDADREWLATSEAAEMIRNGELFAVVKAMQINDLGKLRHGYLVRLRNDL